MTIQTAREIRQDRQKVCVVEIPDSTGVDRLKWFSRTSTDFDALWATHSTLCLERNLYLLFAIALVSLACYVKADSAYRSRYGQMSDTFIEALKQIDQHYIEPVEERRLFEAAWPA